MSSKIFTTSNDAQLFFLDLCSYPNPGIKWNNSSTNTIMAALNQLTIPEIFDFKATKIPYVGIPFLVVLFLLPIPPHHTIPILHYISDNLKRYHMFSPLKALALTSNEETVFEPFPHQYTLPFESSCFETTVQSLSHLAFVSYPNTPIIWCLVHQILVLATKPVIRLSPSSSPHLFALEDISHDSIDSADFDYIAPLPIDSQFKIDFPTQFHQLMQNSTISQINTSKYNIYSFSDPNIAQVYHQPQFNPLRSDLWFRKAIPSNIHALLINSNGLHLPSYFDFSTSIHLPFSPIPLLHPYLHEVPEKAPPQQATILFHSPNRIKTPSAPTKDLSLLSHPLHSTPLTALANMMLNLKSITTHQYQFIVQHGLASQFISSLSHFKYKITQILQEKTTLSPFPSDSYATFHPFFYKSHATTYPSLFLTNQLPQQILSNQSPSAHYIKFPLYPIYHLVCSWILQLYPNQPVNSPLFSLEYQPKTSNLLLEQIQRELEKYISIAWDQHHQIQSLQDSIYGLLPNQFPRYFTLTTLIQLVTHYLVRFNQNDNYIITVIALLYIIQQIPQTDTMIYPYFASFIPIADEYSLAKLPINVTTSLVTEYKIEQAYRLHAQQGGYLENTLHLKYPHMCFPHSVPQTTISFPPNNTKNTVNEAEQDTNEIIHDIYDKTIKSIPLPSPSQSNLLQNSNEFDYHSIQLILQKCNFHNEFQPPVSYDDIFTTLLTWCSDYISAPFHFTREYSQFICDYHDIIHLNEDQRIVALEMNMHCSDNGQQDKTIHNSAINRLNRYRILSTRFATRNEFSLLYYLLVIWKMEISNIDIMVNLIQHTNQFEFYTYPSYNFSDPILATMNQILFAGFALPTPQREFVLSDLSQIKKQYPPHQLPSSYHFNVGIVDSYLIQDRIDKSSKLSIEPIFLLGYLIKNHYHVQMIQPLLNVLLDGCDGSHFITTQDGYGMTILDYCMLYHYYQFSLTNFSQLHKQFLLQAYSELESAPNTFFLVQSLLNTSAQQLASQHSKLIPDGLPEINVHLTKSKNHSSLNSIDTTAIQTKIKAILQQTIHSEFAQVFFMDIYQHNRSFYSFPDTKRNLPILSAYNLAIQKKQFKHSSLSHPLQQFDFPSHISFTLIDDRKCFPLQYEYDQNTPYQTFFLQNTAHSFHRTLDHLPPHSYPIDPTSSSLISPTYNIHIHTTALSSSNVKSLHRLITSSVAQTPKSSPDSTIPTYTMYPETIFSQTQLQTFHDAVIAQTHAIPLRTLLHKYFIYLPAEFDINLDHIQAIYNALIGVESDHSNITTHHDTNFSFTSLIERDFITWPYLLQLLSLPNLTQNFYNQQTLFTKFVIPFLTHYLQSAASTKYQKTSRAQLAHFSFLNQNSNKYLLLSQFDIIYLLYLLVDNNYAPVLVETLLTYISPRYYYYLFYFYTLPQNTHDQLTSSASPTQTAIKQCGKFEPQFHCLTTTTVNSCPSTGVVYTNPMYPFSVRGISCHQNVQINIECELESIHLPNAENPPSQSGYPSAFVSPNQLPKTPHLSEIIPISWNYPTFLHFDSETESSCTQHFLDESHLLPTVFPHINSRSLVFETHQKSTDRRYYPVQPAEFCSSHCGYGFTPQLSIKFISPYQYIEANSTLTNSYLSTSTQNVIEKQIFVKNNTIQLLHLLTTGNVCNCEYCVLHTLNNFTSKAPLLSVIDSIPPDFQNSFNKLSSIHPIQYNISPTLLDLVFTKPNYIEYFYLLLKQCNLQSFIPLHQITSSIYNIGSTYYMQFLHLFLEDWHNYKGKFHSIAMLSTPLPAPINFLSGKDKKFTLDSLSHFNCFDLINLHIIPLLAPKKVHDTPLPTTSQQSRQQSASKPQPKVDAFDPLAKSSFKSKSKTAKTTKTDPKSNDSIEILATPHTTTPVLQLFQTSQDDTINTIDVFHMSIPAIFIYLHYHYPNAVKSQTPFLNYFFLSLQHGASPNHLVPFPQTPVARWMMDHVGVIKNHQLSTSPQTPPLYIRKYVDPGREMFFEQSYVTDLIHSISQPSHAQLYDLAPTSQSKQQEVITQALEFSKKVENKPHLRFNAKLYPYYSGNSGGFFQTSPRIDYLGHDETLDIASIGSPGGDYYPLQVPKPYWNILFYIIFECCWQSTHIPIQSSIKKKNTVPRPFNYLSQTPIEQVKESSSSSSSSSLFKPGNYLHVVQELSDALYFQASVPSFSSGGQDDDLYSSLTDQYKLFSNSWLLDQAQIEEQFMSYQSQLNDILYPFLFRYYTHPSSPFHSHVTRSQNSTRQFKYTTNLSTRNKFTTQRTPFETAQSYRPSRYVFHNIYQIDINQTFPLNSALFHNPTFGAFPEPFSAQTSTPSSSLSHVHLWHLIFTHPSPPIDLITFLYKFNRTDFSNHKEYSHFRFNSSSSSSLSATPNQTNDPYYNDDDYVDDPFDLYNTQNKTKCDNRQSLKNQPQNGTALQFIIPIEVLPFSFKIFLSDHQKQTNVLQFKYTPTYHYNFFTFLILRSADPTIIKHVLNLFHSTPTPIPRFIHFRNGANDQDEACFEEQVQLFHTAFHLIRTYHGIQASMLPLSLSNQSTKEPSLSPLPIHNQSRIQNSTLSVFDLPFDDVLLQYLDNFGKSHFSIGGCFDPNWRSNPNCSGVMNQHSLLFTLDQFIRTIQNKDFQNFHDNLHKTPSNIASTASEEISQQNFAASLIYRRLPKFDSQVAFSIISDSYFSSNVLHQSALSTKGTRKQRQDQENQQEPQTKNSLPSTSSVSTVPKKEHQLAKQQIKDNKAAKIASVAAAAAAAGPKQSSKALSFFKNVDPLDMGVSCANYDQYDNDDDDDQYYDDEDYYSEHMYDEGYYDGEDNFYDEDMDENIDLGINEDIHKNCNSIQSVSAVSPNSAVSIHSNCPNEPPQINDNLKKSNKPPQINDNLKKSNKQTQSSSSQPVKATHLPEDGFYDEDGHWYNYADFE